MASLLGALLRNESGGRNVPNVHQGTSSGQAQGYFQITTGTWNDFGGQKYAPTPLQATYAQQAEIASKIPLKRWDESTVAKMQATGKAIDTSKTLGENLAANNENFGSAETAAASASGAPPNGTGGAGVEGGAAVADAGPMLLPPPRRHYSQLADELSSRVGPRVSGGGGGSSGPLASEGADYVPIPEAFASANPETPLPAPVPTPAGPAADTSLADLFTVGDIGQAAAIDPLTGQPKLPRPRRMSG